MLALYGNGNAEGYPHNGETSSLIVNNITARNVGAKGIANLDSNGIIFCQRSCNIIINNFYIFNTQKYFDDNTVEYFFNGAHYNIHVSNVIIDSDIETLISSGVENVTSEKSTFEVTCNGTILYRTLQRPSGSFINCKFNLKTNKVGSDRFIDASMDGQENNFIEFSNDEFHIKLSAKIGTLSGEGISSNFLIRNFKNQHNPIFTNLNFVDKNGNFRDLSSLTNGQLLFDGNVIT
ncbi:hypothetical protein [Agarilytica rhodophyticola]|uniref:hypothetical protein n=1 Tax=Agarilytica rhodophyticola TaxID=1737490 RepID=UPI000B349665|nr:hypothetical protein [Agarilytica rhodophyticola]